MLEEITKSGSWHLKRCLFFFFFLGVEGGKEKHINHEDSPNTPVPLLFGAQSWRICLT